MSTGTTLERAVVRTVLDNGLTVVIAPDDTAADVAMSVTYRVGFRTESVPGFAHLLEHLMFEGSENVEPLVHGQRVRALGGTLDARTHQDYTQYFQSVPAGNLELLCRLESDRMRAPLFTGQGLRRQLAGIELEIHQIQARPYGGFPWPGLPPLLYQTFANAHDGYGDTATLTGITPADCHSFFDRHYAPGNAVLAVAGNVDPVRALDLIRTWFGPIAGRQVSPLPHLDEPGLSADTARTVTDSRIGRPALAIGYRLPEPSSPAYPGHLVLAKYLQARMIGGDASCGFFGAFDALAPDTMVITATHDLSVSPAAVLATVDNLLAAAANGLSKTQLSALHDLVCKDLRTTGALGTARALGRFEALFGATEPHSGLIDEIDLAAAAAAVAAQHRAVLRVVPERGRA